MEFTKESIAKPKYMALYSGRLVDIFDLSIEDIDIEDISHALSNLCRFGGHCLFHYSVATHSVKCSYAEGSVEEKLAFLLHDASEAFMNDLVRPIKHREELKYYREQEDKIQEIIFKKFGLEYPFSQRVHDVDNQVLIEELKRIIITGDEIIEKSQELNVSMREARKILRQEKLDNCDIPRLTPEESEQIFLDRFYELMKLREL